MSSFPLRYLWLILLISGSPSATLFAQQPVIELYQVKVVTKNGTHFRGILEDVADSYLYLENAKHGRSGRIPLTNIRKVVLRRASKKNILITGAIIGGLLGGFASYQSLEKNQTRGSVGYGLTLTFAAAGGAAFGLLAGSAVGNLTSRVIRPIDPANPVLSLQRQLEPFCERYQQDFINRLPQSN